jgi:hypothetical protein
VDDDEFTTVIQNAVERDLNPVSFGRTERVVLWVLLVLALVSAATSLLTLLLTY